MNLHSNMIPTDQQRLSRCLIPHLWSSLERPQLLALVPWLCSIGSIPCVYHHVLCLTVVLTAMSTDSLLAQRATDLLVYTARQCAGAALDVSPLIVSCLRGSGAKENSLTPFVTRAIDVQCAAESAGHRLKCMMRLVSIVKAFVGYILSLHATFHQLIIPCCRNDAVSVEDIPDAIFSLLLIGIDPNSPSLLKTEVMVSIDMLGSRIPGTSDDVSSLVGGCLYHFVQLLIASPAGTHNLCQASGYLERPVRDE